MEWSALSDQLNDLFLTSRKEFSTKGLTGKGFGPAAEPPQAPGQMRSNRSGGPLKGIQRPLKMRGMKGLEGGWVSLPRF